MLRHLASSLADQSQVRVHLSSGAYLDGVVTALDGGEVELRHPDGSRTLVLLGHIIATTIR